MLRLRILCCAPVWLLVPRCAGAEAAALPSVFAPTENTKAKSQQTPPAPPPTAISDRVHRLVAQQVRANVSPLLAQPSSPPADAAQPAATSGPVVLLAPFTVTAKSERVSELPKPVSLAQDFKTRRVFLRALDGRLEGNLNLVRVYSNRLGSRGEETLVELRFNLRW